MFSGRVYAESCGDTDIPGAGNLAYASADRFAPYPYLFYSGVFRRQFRSVIGYNPVDYSGIMNTETIQITPELLALIAEIDEFKGAWRALGTLAPETAEGVCAGSPRLKASARLRASRVAS